MTKQIPLNKGMFATVDDEDYDRLAIYKWHVASTHGVLYAARAFRLSAIKTEAVLMHREILGLTKGDGKQCDHKDRNGLNNCRANLRICTIADNNRNRTSKNKTGYRGVYYSERHHKYRARIRTKIQSYHLGYFDTSELAARAVDAKTRELYGEFYVPNLPN